MLSTFALLLPCSVCFIWFFVAVGKKNKSYQRRLLTVLTLLSAIYFLSDANYVAPNVNSMALVLADISSKFITLAIFPVMCFYIKALTDENPVPLYAWLLLLPSFVLGTIAAVIYSLVGFAESAEFIRSIDTGASFISDKPQMLFDAYNTVCIRVYNITILVSVIVSCAYVIKQLVENKFSFTHARAFLYSNKPSLIANIESTVFILLGLFILARVLLGRIWLSEHTAVSGLLSLCMAILAFAYGYIGLVPQLNGGYLTLDRIIHASEGTPETTPEYLQSIDSGPVVTPPVGGYEKLAISFQNAMQKEQVYLDPMLTIESLADKLNTNRTYLSKLVNIKYGLPFRDYLSMVRIEYAQHLIRLEPDATFEYIASRSGFQSASQFNRKFREMTGVAPSVWRSSSQPAE